GRPTPRATLPAPRPPPPPRPDPTLQPAATQQLPFTQYHNTLTYAQRQLQSTGRLYQGDSEAVALDVRLPIDLALTDLPLAQRLVEAPVAIHIRLQQPHLEAVRHWQPALPHLEGTLQGTVDIEGTYTAFDFDASTTLQQFGIEGLVAHLQTPVHLHGTFVTAPSLAALVQAIEQRRLTPQMPNLELRIPTLSGRVLMAKQRTVSPPSPREAPEGTVSSREGMGGSKPTQRRQGPDGPVPARQASVAGQRETGAGTHAPTQSRQRTGGEGRRRARPTVPHPPSLKPLPEAEGEAVQVEDLLLQASAQWTADG